MTASWMGWQGSIAISHRGSTALRGPGHGEDAEAQRRRAGGAPRLPQ